MNNATPSGRGTPVVSAPVAADGANEAPGAAANAEV